MNALLFDRMRISQQRMQIFSIHVRTVPQAPVTGHDVKISVEILSIVVDEDFCQAAISWDLTPSVN
jgi:hypothetical protein